MSAGTERCRLFDEILVPIDGSDCADLAVEGYDAGLVVTGTHGRTGTDRYLFASVTERVVRQSAVPVLTVRKKEEDVVNFPYSNILVPTDGSDGTADGFDPGIDIAASSDDSAIRRTRRNGLRRRSANEGSPQTPRNSVTSIRPSFGARVGAPDV
ncbi:universal stress protein [Natrinema longum]|uniref:universal stress protein n=1 Tax=Natrinema longum TaxID=370324 RepID=UPI001CCF1612|nr:universal stress protein [Natrinema longum]MBZ6497067.1 universal stress protein [Natrinema longum]